MWEIKEASYITTELWKLCRVCRCSSLLNLLPVKRQTVWSSHRRYQWELLCTGEWLWWVQSRRGIDERSVSHRWEDQVWWRRYRSSCEMAHALMPFKHRSVPTRRELQRLYCLWGSPLQRTHTSGEICRSQSFKLGNVTLCMQEWRSNSASHFRVKCWVERLRELFFPGQKASKLLALYQLWQGPVNFTAKSALPFGEAAVLSAEKREAVFTSDSKVFFRGCFDWGPKIRTAHRVAEVQLWGQSTGMFYSAATQHCTCIARSMILAKAAAKITSATGLIETLHARSSGLAQQMDLLSLAVNIKTSADLDTAWFVLFWSISCCSISPGRSKPNKNSTSPDNLWLSYFKFQT